MKQKITFSIIALFTFYNSVLAQLPSPDISTPLQKAQQVVLLNGTLTKITQSWMNNSHVTMMRDITTTDSRGAVLFSENYYYNGTTLVKQSWSNANVTYDGNGRVLTSWSKSTSVDTNNFAITWIYQVGYDANGRMTYYNKADSFYNGSTLSQTTVQVDSFYYNTAGKLTRKDTYTRNLSGVYGLNFTQKVTYDASNNPVDIDYAYTANNDYAVMYRMKLAWDAQNRMTSIRQFPAFSYLQYKDSVYEQKSQYFYYKANGELNTVIDSQYSGNGLVLNAVYRSFVFTNGKLMQYAQDFSQYNLADSLVYYRNSTGLPDSVLVYRNQGSGYSYIGRILYNTQGGNPTGINELATAVVHVYPNPAAEYIVVETDEELTRCTLRNLEGAVVLEQPAGNEGMIRLDCSHLVPGVYLLEVKTKNAAELRKLIIQ
jgi:hypothetical protein